MLQLDSIIEKLSNHFQHKQHVLFLGRQMLYPIAMEGALKLKEISYLHAESYPAGELKHGPLALIEKGMPVIVLMPSNVLFDKLYSNVKEVQARYGDLIVFTDSDQLKTEKGLTVVKVPFAHPMLTPIIYTLPLQMLAYHVAVLKGTDVDQPRNLAKSVTVE
jgi:glucosamine--fructose-6-phosphate aminotransferase (isomerizing)